MAVKSEFLIFWVMFVLTLGMASCAPLLETPALPLVQTFTPVLPEATNTSVAKTPAPPAQPAETPTQVTETAQTEMDACLQLPSYSMKVVFDEEDKHLRVNEKLSYRNRWGETLEELFFIVEPNRKAGVFILNRIQYEDGSGVAQYFLDGASLRVPLRSPLAPGDAATLELDFELFLPENDSFFGYNTRQSNLGDWYPIVPVYLDGEGWMVHPMAPVGEHIVYDVADYDVEIRLAHPYSNALVAGSGKPDPVGNLYRFHSRAARNFTWMTSSSFVVVSQQFGDTLVEGFVYPEHLQAGQHALQTIAMALDLYAESYAPYEKDYLAFVETDMFDGKEYDGLFFLNQNYFAYSEGAERSGLTALIAHEVAHQWWYARVGNNPALEPWLDEALCIYSELLFYEKLYPQAIPSWWDYRVNEFSPSGWVNATIYDYSSYRPYVNAVYLQGVHFMAALQERIGQEALLGALQKYASVYRCRLANAEGLIEILGEASPANLDTLFDQYFKPQ